MSLGTRARSLGGGLVSLFLLMPALSAAENDLRITLAAKKRDVQVVRSLIQQKVDVNAAEPDGTTALAWAVNQDDLEMAELLIGAGADVNAATEIGVTPLFLAIDTGNAAMVKKLLEARANLNTSLWSGETPLMRAASAGNPDVVKALLASGANVNAKEPRRGQTALMWAIAEGHPEIARLLIENGADIRARTHRYEGFQPMVFTTFGADVPATASGGYTPLLFAVKAGDLETVRLLVEKGEDVNQATVDEGSALLMAAEAGHEKLAIFLLEKGADPNARGPVDGMTALHHAMRDGLSVLHGRSISKVARICPSGPWRCVALENLDSVPFLSGGDFPVVRFLREEGVFDVSVNKSERLAKAVNLLAKNPGYGIGRNGTFTSSNMRELAKALLARGADPNVPMMDSPGKLRRGGKPMISLQGTTPIMLAAAAHDVESIRILAEGRATLAVKTTSIPKEINRKEFGGENQIQGNGTPLLVAAGLGRTDDMASAEQQRSLEAVKTLVEMGANVNLASDTGWTPLHAAAYMGSDSVVEYLVSKGANINSRTGCGQTPLSLAAATNVDGLLDTPTPHPSTAALLQKLGALEEPSTTPLGACVLGFRLAYDQFLHIEKGRKQREEHGGSPVAPAPAP